MSALRAPQLFVDDRRDEAAARSLKKLLGSGSVRGDLQQPDGSYRKLGPRRARFTIDDLAAHYRGELALAVLCVEHGLARYLCWDCDDHGPLRIRILWRVLDRRGLSTHAFATGGSSTDRGKLILFCRPAPQEAARDLALAILAEASTEPDWPPKETDIKVCPELGEGGLIRIGGRNIARRARVVETFTRVDTGEVVELWQIGRADLGIELVPQPVKPPPTPRYVTKLLETGFTRWPADGTAGVNRTLTRIALFAVKTGLHREAFLRMISEIRGRSTAFATPSLKNRDKRDPLSEKRALSAWMRAEKRTRATLHPPRPPSGDVMWHSQQKRTDDDALFEALNEVCNRRDLHRDAFGCSYRELSRLLGWSDPKKAHRVAKRLSNAGRIVIVDRGSQGEMGNKTIFALPSGRSPEATLRAADCRPVTRERREKQARYYAEQAKKVASLLRPVTAVVVSVSDELAAYAERVLPQPVRPARGANSFVVQSVFSTVDGITRMIGAEARERPRGYASG